MKTQIPSVRLCVNKVRKCWRTQQDTDRLPSTLWASLSAVCVNQTVVLTGETLTAIVQGYLTSFWAVFSESPQRFFAAVGNITGVCSQTCSTDNVFAFVHSKWILVAAVWALFISFWMKFCAESCICITTQNSSFIWATYYSASLKHFLFSLRVEIRFLFFFLLKAVSLEWVKKPSAALWLLCRSLCGLFFELMWVWKYSGASSVNGHLTNPHSMQ